VVAILDELPFCLPYVAEQTDGNNSLPSDTVVLGDMAVPRKSDDPTEAVTALAIQMEINGTSDSSASDIVELLEVKNGAVSTLPHVPGGIASGTGCYVTSMRSGWDDCSCWWNLPTHWEENILMKRNNMSGLFWQY